MFNNKGQFTPKKEQLKCADTDEPQTLIRKNHGIQERDNQQTFGNRTNYRQRLVALKGPNNSKHLFPLYKDKDIGFTHQFQNQIHSSYNDDDRMTTSTQLQLAMSQTYDDLMQVLNPNQKNWCQKTQ